MLNELLQVERGARDAGITMTARHSDIKDSRRLPTLLVSLEEAGSVSKIRLISRAVTPWTLRDGQHNSFPFVQPKPPLWAPLSPEPASSIDRKNVALRRENLLRWAKSAQFNVDAFRSWPGGGFLARLRERRSQLDSLKGTEGERMLLTLDRFILGCSYEKCLLENVPDLIVQMLNETGDQDWLEVAESLLVGNFDSKEGQFKCSGGLLFEAATKARKQLSLVDSRMAELVSGALRGGTEQRESFKGICALRGRRTTLVSGSFPQPNLPVLGQSFLFAKNKDIPANDRYGQSAAKAMPVGEDTIVELSAAFSSLTAPERKGVTWRSLPGESPKQQDLMLAFVKGVLDVAVVKVLADDQDDANATDADDGRSESDPIGRYEINTERLIETVKGRIGVDFRQAPVQVAIFRKLDPANRKIVYTGAPTIGALWDGAKAWIKGETNVPEWLTIPVPVKGERQLRATKPPHIAPLGLIMHSKQLFLRSGTRREEVAGVAAAEALQLFLDSQPGGHGASRRLVLRVLRLILSRRCSLLIGVSHLLHTPDRWERRRDRLKEYDKREALITVTIICILLRKLGRTREEYMTEVGFKLGQLLAAADIVHAGYCSDVRGGDIPPALLGNQVFAMAQTSPIKAVNLLCRRWKPYHAWASRENRNRERADIMVGEKSTEKKRGWDIKKAVRHWREMETLAEELRILLPQCKVDDAYRAELLLGYLAGFKPVKKVEANG